MSISDDITAVLGEIGVACTITKPDGTVITGEYIDTNPHTNNTTPLISSFFRNFALGYQTQANVGDIIDYGYESVLLLSKAPELFEGAPIEYIASGYVANVTGTIQNYDQAAGYDTDYTRIRSWVDVYANIAAVMTDRIFRSNVSGIGDDSIFAEVSKLHLYVSDYYSGIKMGMRFTTASGDKYKVDQIEKDRMLGIHMVFLSEDTRD